MKQTLSRWGAVLGAVLAVAGLMYGTWPGATWTPGSVQAAASYPPKNGDPCTLNMRIVTPISLTASGQVVTGIAGKQTYVCQIEFVTGAAQNIALVEGTGTVCATGVTGMAGGATAATGWNLAINQAVNAGVGHSWVLATATAADNVCLLLSGSGQTSGSIQYVQQ